MRRNQNPQQNRQYPTSNTYPSQYSQTYNVNVYQSAYRSHNFTINSQTTMEQAEQIVRHMGYLYNTVGVVMKDIIKIMALKFPSISQARVGMGMEINRGEERSEQNIGKYMRQHQYGGNDPGYDNKNEVMRNQADEQLQQEYRKSKYKFQSIAEQAQQSYSMPNEQIQAYKQLSIHQPQNIDLTNPFQVYQAQQIPVPTFQVYQLQLEQNQNKPQKQPNKNLIVSETGIKNYGSINIRTVNTLNTVIQDFQLQNKKKQKKQTKKQAKWQAKKQSKKQTKRKKTSPAQLAAQVLGPIPFQFQIYDESVQSSSQDQKQSILQSHSQSQGQPQLQSEIQKQGQQNKNNAEKQPNIIQIDDD